MPLPSDWDGIFYGPATQGDLLYDMPPAEFVSAIAAADEIFDPEFLVAGAITDFMWYHADTDRLIKLVAMARAAWLEQRIHALTFVCYVSDMLVKTGVSADAVTEGTTQALMALSDLIIDPEAAGYTKADFAGDEPCERAIELTELGRERWSDFPWAAPAFVALIGHFVSQQSHVDRKALTLGISNAIAGFFSGVQVFTYQ